MAYRFVEESAPKYRFVEEEPATPGDTVKRALGLTVRSLIEGALSIPGVVAGGLGGVYNVGADLLQGKGQGYRVKDPNQQLSQTLTQWGLPKPESGLEKIADVGTQMLAGSAAVPIPTPKAQPPAVKTVKELATERVKDAGYVLPPSATGGNFFTNMLESLGGKAALKQEAGLRNQQITTDLARRGAGLLPEEQITKDALRIARKEMSQPYRDVAGMSQVAGKALDKLEDARAEMKLAFNEYNRTANRQALKDAKSLQGTVQTLERVIDREAAKSGNTALPEALREARASLAKSHDVERALNSATGDVSARTMGRMLDKKPLSDELLTIATMGRAFPQYSGDAAMLGTPGVSALNPLASAVLGASGNVILGNPAGGALAFLPTLRGPVRNMLLSPKFQGLLQSQFPPGMAMPLFAGEEAIRGNF